MNFFRAKASPSKQATVAFPGLNYDITHFASIFKVGNGYCGINIFKKTRFAPDKKANRSIGFLVKSGRWQAPAAHLSPVSTIC